jgi:hypothetical protein
VFVYVCGGGDGGGAAAVCMRSVCEVKGVKGVSLGAECSGAAKETRPAPDNAPSSEELKVCKASVMFFARGAWLLPKKERPQQARSESARVRCACVCGAASRVMLPIKAFVRGEQKSGGGGGRGGRSRDEAVLRATAGDRPLAAVLSSYAVAHTSP